MKYLWILLSALVVSSAAGAQFEAAADQPDPREAFVPAKLDVSGAPIVAGMNRFGFDLYGKLSRERGDLAISPASISTAFGLAYAGARGTTAQEIAAVLRYPRLADFHESFGAVLRSMDLHQNGRTLTVANALWLQDGFKVRPEYAALIQRSYGAGIQRVDYRADSEAARSKINGWVESRTNNRIRSLLSKENVTAKTRSVLVNTVYFKADWADPFNENATKAQPFTLESGKQVSRRLMNRRFEVAYAEREGVKAIALPYRGGEAEMVFLLPDKADQLRQVEASLTPERLDGWIRKLDGPSTTVDVSIPRFRIENRFELTDTLRDMGMRVAFSNESDFSGAKIVNPASSNEEDWNLKIDNVVHQVFVEVEEKGTEAAAATAITTILITGARLTREPKVFRADHPFLFLIRDQRTNAILFVGRYTGENA